MDRREFIISTGAMAASVGSGALALIDKKELKGPCGGPVGHDGPLPSGPIELMGSYRREMIMQFREELTAVVEWPNIPDAVAHTWTLRVGIYQDISLTKNEQGGDHSTPGMRYFLLDEKRLYSGGRQAIFHCLNICLDGSSYKLRIGPDNRFHDTPQYRRAKARRLCREVADQTWLMDPNMTSMRKWIIEESLTLLAKYIRNMSPPNKIVLENFSLL